MRSSALAVLVTTAAGCGTLPDTRPATTEVITYEVLAPTCGQVQCHSSSTNLQGYTLDTVAGVKATLPDLLRTRNNGKTRLVEFIEATGPDRMPPDVPMASEDLALLQKWIDAGGLNQ